MIDKNRTVIFIGEEIKYLSKPNDYPFKTAYFNKSDDFFKYLKKGKKSLQDIVVLHYFRDIYELNGFVEKAQKEISQIFFITPLVACLSEGCSDTKGSSLQLQMFDYAIFTPIGPENLEPIVNFASRKKKEILDRSSLYFIYQAILRDLLERKNTNDSSNLINVSQSYFSVDKYGIFQTIGDEVLSILGFSRDEIIGRHFLELATKEEYEKVKKAFTERRTGSRRAKEIAVKFQTKDGRYEEFIIEAQGVHIPSVYEYPQKDPMRLYVGTFGRATPASKAERYIDVFDSSLEPIVIYNSTDRKLIVNQGFEEFSGYKKEELKDKNPEYFEKSGKSFFSRYSSTVPEKGHAVYNTVIVIKSGQERYCEVSLDHVLFEGKSIFIAIYSDLTNFLKLIDEAETLIQLSWEIGNTSSLIDLVATAAEKGFSILKVPFLAIALLEEDQKIVTSYHVKTGAEGKWIGASSAVFHESLDPLIKESVREKKTVYRTVPDILTICEVPELIEKGKNGVVVISPLIVSDKVIGCIIVLEEEESTFTLHGIRLLELSSNVIAAGIYKLHLENELRKSLETLESRVRERTKELEDFIYTISHDLKSPLHAAQGFADMVKKQFETHIKSNEDEYILRRIRENIDHAVFMINDLLELSRIGTREFKFEKVNLNTIINEYDMQFNALSKEDIQLNIEIGEKIPPIYADMGRMVQLITNLFDNSVKYRSGNNVKIVIEREIADGKVKLFIGDNGSGIEEKDLDNVFKIFYRGRGALERCIEGSGLGLTIVKKIVEQHGGSIDIKSKLNKGTTVIIELPIHR